MATDYDAPRRGAEDEEPDAGLEHLAGNGRNTVEVEDEDALAEGLVLPGADLSGESLTVRVVPRQMDEFMCTSCFLLMHELPQRRRRLPRLCLTPLAASCRVGRPDRP